MPATLLPAIRCRKGNVADDDQCATTVAAIDVCSALALPRAEQACA